MNNWYEPKGGRQSSHWNPCILPLLLSALWPARSGDTAVHRTKRGACHHALWETSTWTKRCCCCSVAQSCSTLCDPMDCSTRGFPVLHYLPEFAQTHVHWVDGQFNKLAISDDDHWREEINREMRESWGPLDQSGQERLPEEGTFKRRTEWQVGGRKREWGLWWLGGLVGWPCPGRGPVLHRLRVGSGGERWGACWYVWRWVEGVMNSPSSGWSWDPHGPERDAWLTQPPSLPPLLQDQLRMSAPRGTPRPLTNKAGNLLECGQTVVNCSILKSNSARQKNPHSIRFQSWDIFSISKSKEAEK